MRKQGAAAMLAGFVLFFAVPAAAAIEAISYGEKVIGPQKHAIHVRALGPDLFGEEVSASSGGISFSQTDLALPGNDALSVSVTRRLEVDGNKTPSSPGDESLWRGYAFGEWDLDLPYLSATYAQSQGWVVDTSTPNARCSSPTTADQYRPPSTSVGEVHFVNYSIWNGISLNVPGEGEQGTLYRGPGGAIPTPSGSWTNLTTKSHWRFGCLTALQSGQAGEGFLALAPDGTKYYFDWMIDYLERPLKGTGTIVLGNGRVFRQSAELPRRSYRIYPTRIEDRFGNHVTYTWSGTALNSITASDGRQISFTYSGGRIISATTGTRSVSYGYSDGLLTSVTLPDNSQFTFSSVAMLGLARFVPMSDADPFDFPMSCQLMRRLTGATGDLVMTHPSGAVGTYRMGYRRHYRTNLSGSTGMCDAVMVGEDDADTPANTFWSHKPYAPNRFDTLALQRKTLTGPGLSAQAWEYQHQDDFQMTPGYPVGGTRTVTTTKPDSSVTLEVFGTDALANEGHLLSQEIREGSTVLSRRENTYVQTSEMGSMPFPDWMGQPLAYEYIRGRGDYNRPLKSSKTLQQGASFFNTVTAFDALTRTTLAIERSELVTPGVTSYSRTVATVYEDNTAAWVLGQQKQRSVNGVVAEATTYSPTTALPLTKSAFGKLQQTFTYNANGTLATVKDGNNNVITVSDWHRGIPRLIQYPATPEAPSGSSQSAEVDNNGWIKSVIDEAGSKTCYGYDAMGRLTRLTYPSEAAGVCDASIWNEEVLSFVPTTAQFGIPAGHWAQVHTRGAYRKITHFDAMWRPIFVQEEGEPGTVRYTRQAFDHDGRTIFSSYPVASASNIGNLTAGAWTTYDALGRVTASSQDSEQGLLTTLTTYDSQFRITTTNPRSASATTRFKAYGSPSRDWPVEIVHPEGAITDIARDDFGKPQSITRRNAANSLLVTRTYDYDTYQQLCRSVEPETGATLMGYDGAGNLTWSAAGVATTLGCADGSNAAVLARKVSRTYDARNRVASLTFPGTGLGSTSFTYFKDGKQASLTTANGTGLDVTNTYTYKRRGQLASERQQWGGVDLTVDYSYDGNGTLSATAAPGLTVGYAPNALGQATQAGTYATGVQYYPNGAIKQFTYGNGIVHSMAQNARQLPSRVIDSGGVLDNEYAYDANGNVQSILDWRDGNQNRAMTYDGLDRLLTASSPAFAASGGGQVHHFAYNVLDNLTSWTRTGAKDYAEYIYTNNRLTNIKNSGGATIVGLDYDVQGNLTNKNGQVYAFDYGNRLRDAPGNSTYAYDGLGRRVLDRTTADKHSLYSQSGQLLYENDLRQAKTTRYVYLGGSLVARVVNSTAPAAPLLSAPSFNTTGSYTVSWTASSGATGYQLEEAVSGGAWTSAYSGAGLSLAVTGKPAGNHGYRVRACLNAGCSAWSTTAAVSVQYPPGSAPVLSAPGTAAGGNYAVTWTSLGGVTEYRLEVSVNGGGWTSAYTGAGVSQSYSGQAAGAYAYRVQACNPAGCGPYSATVTVQSVHAPAAAPSLSLPAVGAEGNFTISWTGVSGATSYTVERSINGGGWASVYSGAGGSLGYSAQAAGSYAFRVAACNTAGCGPQSAVGTVQAVYAPAAAPTISVPALGANGAYAVGWSGIGGATSYVLERSDNGGGWSPVYSGAGTGQSYSGQAAGTYAFRVTGCNAAGCGPYSATGTVQVLYAPASAPGVSAPATNGTGSYTVSWSGVGGATSYQLQEQVGGGAWTALYDGGAVSVGVTGRASATYGYRAIACNAAGCGPWSSTSNTVVSYVPATPTGLGGMKNTDTEVQPPVTYWQVQWNASVGATRYEVDMKVGTGTRSQVYNGPNTFVTGTGMATRQFWVRACSSAGCSAWSAPFTL